jgi:hypothetical protein
MRQRARTDLCGGRSATVVPTATKMGVESAAPAARFFDCNIRSDECRGVPQEQRVHWSRY